MVLRWRPAEIWKARASGSLSRLGPTSTSPTIGPSARISRLSETFRFCSNRSFARTTSGPCDAVKRASNSNCVAVTPAQVKKPRTFRRRQNLRFSCGTIANSRHSSRESGVASFESRVWSRESFRKLCSTLQTPDSRPLTPDSRLLKGVSRAAFPMSPVASPGRWFGGRWRFGGGRRYNCRLLRCGLLTNKIGNGLLRNFGLQQHFGISRRNHQTAQYCLGTLVLAQARCLLQQT